MSTTSIPEIPDSLDERVRDHREAFTELMVAAGRCDDISSGFVIDLDDILTDPNS